MKKTFIYAMLGAIALTGATTVTSCTSTDDVADVNPTYNPETGEITTQFVLNVATNAKDNASTRSGATTVQNDGINFRGINNTVLLAYQTGGQKFIGATQIAADAAKRYDLGMVAAENSITAANSHRILELSIPTETDALLFYGKAIKGNGSDIEAGKVTYNVTGSKADQFTFSLNSRVGDNEAKFEQTANLLAAILNKIIAASSSYDINTDTYPDWTGAATISESFKDLGTIYAVNNDNDGSNNRRVLSPLEDILGQAFYTLTTIKDEEYRAGSGDAVIETVKELFDVINTVCNATPTSPYEELGKAVAQAVKTEITKYFTTDTQTGKVTGFIALANIKSALNDTENNYDKVVDGDLAAFPTTTFLLPKGCAVMTYDGETNTFSYLLRRAIVGSALSGENEATRYQFPAELMYFANSSIRTSDTEKKAGNYPNGVANWDENDKWDTDWSAAGSKVTSSTRATAMTQNVNYGVALLETKVGIKEAVTGLEDNNKAFHPTEENKTISPANLDLTLTGVLVGGQPKSVDWQYLPVDGTAYDRVIYDNAIAGGTSGTAVPKTAGATSAPNYTLVFDNYTTAADQISEVRVALEFTNNSDSFWGKDNIVKKGSTFYLIGTLAKGDKTIASWDEYYQVPPLDANGKSQKITRIFTQDYRTTATFLLTENSLKGAYNTLPDLRSSQISFGLSVDLDWRPGLVFNDVELGPNN